VLGHTDIGDPAGLEPRRRYGHRDHQGLLPVTARWTRPLRQPVAARRRGAGTAGLAGGNRFCRRAWLGIGSMAPTARDGALINCHLPLVTSPHPRAWQAPAKPSSSRALPPADGGAASRRRAVRFLRRWGRRQQCGPYARYARRRLWADH
jgi:hypothetical protein